VFPYIAGEKEWPHEQIEEFDVSPNDMGLFYLAAARYKEPKYREIVERVRDRLPKFEYVRLQFPIN
jgi:hypothetical protein